MEVSSARCVADPDTVHSCFIVGRDVGRDVTGHVVQYTRGPAVGGEHVSLNRLPFLAGVRGTCTQTGPGSGGPAGKTSLWQVCAQRQQLAVHLALGHSSAVCLKQTVGHLLHSHYYPPDHAVLGCHRDRIKELTPRTCYTVCLPCMFWIIISNRQDFSLFCIVSFWLLLIWFWTLIN